MRLSINGNNNFIITKPVENGSSSYMNGKSFSYLYDDPIHTVLSDAFSYNIIDKKNTTQYNVDYKLTIIPSPIFGKDDNALKMRIAISFFISLLVILFILYITNKFIRNANNKENSSHKLMDIILDADWQPSLALFQFTLWTILIVMVFLAIYLIRIFSGYIDIGNNAVLPENLLIVMGLSATSTIIGYFISWRNYLSEQRPEKPHPYLNMLCENTVNTARNKKISLTRFQMFAWTFIGIGYYIAVLIALLLSLTIKSTISIPDLPEIFIILMGISQFSYLTGKYMSKSDKILVNDFQPSEQIIGNPIHLYGSNIESGEAVDLNIWLDGILINKNTLRNNLRGSVNLTKNL